MNTLNVDVCREVDGRWIGETIEIPGALACGSARNEAIGLTISLASPVIADRLAHGEALPEERT